MKAIPQTREYRALSHAEKQRLLKVFAEQEDRDLMAVLDETLKMACVILHSGFKMDENQLLVFLASFKRAFSQHAYDIREGRKNERLDAQIAAIFPSGYPDFVFENYFAHWPTKERETR